MGFINRSIDLSRGTRRFQRWGRPSTGAPSGGASGPRGIFDPDLLKAALPESVRKLDPRRLARNPVMFIVEITAVLVTLIAIGNMTGFQTVAGPAGLGFQVQIAVWLWFTVLFATYAEAVAEARGRAQAATLRRTRSVTVAFRRRADGSVEQVGSSELRRDDIVVVDEGQTIPGDGDVIEGIGFVNESAITGESAPVLKEPGTDIRSSVTGGTTLTSDRLVIRITADPGETFLDRMIALVEGAKRQRTPNEIALSILLAGLSIVFLLVTVTLRPFGQFAGTVVDTVALVALLVCLIPTTIGGLLSAIGIAGMDRVARFNVLAMSGRAVEASGDVDVILLDKTGTITYGNRLAASITAAPGVSREEALTAALVASIRDETPEGRSIAELARKLLQEIGARAGTADDAGLATLSATIDEDIPFRAETRTSGVRTKDGSLVLKGAVDAIGREIEGALPAAILAETDRIADLGATPLAIRRDQRVLGLIEL
ncbi:MAG TPA: HAD-IC family P-type ATPase, partial [Candidatus Limnocylindrales bacterium]